LGAPFARWFSIEEDSEDDMEGSSMGGGPSKVVKFTGSNRIMTVSELRNLVYQKTLAVGSKRSHSAHTQTQVEKFGVLRDCCDGEARVLLNDHFQARIDRNRELYEAVEAENLQLETQTRAAWQRAYDAYTASWQLGNRLRRRRRRRRHKQQRLLQPPEQGQRVHPHRHRHRHHRHRAQLAELP
jgi:hypothetical protein